MSTHLSIQAGGAERLREFMARIAGETYPEPMTPGHTSMTRDALERVLALMPEKPEKVLDVGCGQGPALAEFKARGMSDFVYGIALNKDDVKACRKAGYKLVFEMDQNDLQFPDSTFDLVWARHVVEHSIAPLWTLTEFWRVLKPGGALYMEVPAPDTVCRHETNQNHYSVLGQQAWYCLLLKGGFGVVQAWRTNLDTPAGADVYFSFVGRKPFEQKLL